MILIPVELECDICNHLYAAHPVLLRAKVPILSVRDGGMWFSLPTDQLPQGWRWTYRRSQPGGGPFLVCGRCAEVYKVDLME